MYMYMCIYIYIYIYMYTWPAEPHTGCRQGSYLASTLASKNVASVRHNLCFLYYSYCLVLM